MKTLSTPMVALELNLFRSAPFVNDTNRSLCLNGICAKVDSLYYTMESSQQMFYKLWLHFKQG